MKKYLSSILILAIMLSTSAFSTAGVTEVNNQPGIFNEEGNRGVQELRHYVPAVSTLTLKAGDENLIKADNENGDRLQNASDITGKIQNAANSFDLLTATVENNTQNGFFLQLVPINGNMAAIQDTNANEQYGTHGETSITYSISCKKRDKKGVASSYFVNEASDISPAAGSPIVLLDVTSATTHIEAQVQVSLKFDSNAQNIIEMAGAYKERFILEYVDRAGPVQSNVNQ